MIEGVSREEQRIRRWSRVGRFLATGGLAAALGIPIFVLSMFVVGVLCVPFLAGKSDVPFFPILAAEVCLIGFLMSWFVGSLRFTLAARWACPLAYLFVSCLCLPVVIFIVRDASSVPYLLLAAILCTFAGGDLGDRRRQRREMRQMAREADEADRAFGAMLQKQAGWDAEGPPPSDESG